MSNLAEETMKAMNYREGRRCDNCKHFTEKDHPYVDRMWVSICTFSNLSHFEVKKDAVCDRFEEKK